MLTVFWGSQGLLLNIIKTGFNSEQCSLQWDAVGHAIRSKRTGLLSVGVVLQHHNASPHSTVHSVETLQKLNSEVLEHPPDSANLVLFDYDRLAHLNKPEETVGLSWTSNWRKWCKRGLSLSPNLCILRASRKLCGDGPSAAKRKGAMLKSCILVSSLLNTQTHMRIITYSPSYYDGLEL